VRASPRIDHVVFWHHSLTVASVTRAVARLTQGVKVDHEEAYVAGLLHELGALVLDQFFEKLYDAVFRASQHVHQSIHQVEQEYLGIDHAELGGWLLDHWQTPKSLADAVRFHHQPSEAPEEHRTLCHVVHVADYISTTHGISGPGEENLFVINATAWEDLGLQVGSLPDLITEVTTEAERSKMFLAVAAA
jgi:putative nucleotidyltransferase with HDIG domain